VFFLLGFALSWGIQTVKKPPKKKFNVEPMSSRQQEEAVTGLAICIGTRPVKLKLRRR
jgi:hypothetical protein